MAAPGLGCGTWDFSIFVVACRIEFPNQGPPHWENGVLATGPPGKSQLLSNVVVRPASPLCSATLVYSLHLALCTCGPVMYVVPPHPRIQPTSDCAVWQCLQLKTDCIQVDPHSSNLFPKSLLYSVSKLHHADRTLACFLFVHIQCKFIDFVSISPFHKIKRGPPLPH